MIKISNSFISAPLSGVTDYPFRMMIRKFSKNALIFSEMISADLILQKHIKTLKMFIPDEFEKPIGVQIVGNNPQKMPEAAKICQDKGAAVIDINMGCPVKKLISNQSGAALMTNINLAAEIINRTAEAVSIPVTVKFRAGWDENNINAVEFAIMAQEQGAAAVTVHGRTRSQLYSGKVNFDIIAEVKNNLKIPVIGNGDVVDKLSAQNMQKYTNCDAIMIGRGLMGRPWLLQELFDNNFIPPDLIELEKIIFEHYDAMCNYYGTYVALRVARKHIGWYIKGLKKAKEFREIFNQITDVDKAKKAICNLFKEQ
jgi:tRNA-dihydrouridine synthase B